MTHDAVWAIVPVKRLAAAKTRLASVLDADARARLAELMLEDVLEGLRSCDDLLAGVLVVTADARAAALARNHGTDIVPEPADAGLDDSGLNSAIGQAVRRIGPARPHGMLVVPADVPQVSRSAIGDAVAAIAEAPAVAVVPARDDGGTNLLAARPADVIVPCFGPRSFARHCGAARRAGIEPCVLTGTTLGLDIDRPDDLAAFLALDTRTRTHAFLAARAVAGQTRPGPDRGATSLQATSAGLRA